MHRLRLLLSNIMNKSLFIAAHSMTVAGLLYALGGPVLGAGPAVSAAPNAPASPMTAAAPAATPSYKEYTYYGDRYRDPFIPLNGDIRTDQSALDRPPQVSSLALKGIVQDARGRMALLTSGVNSYILKGGRLYDGRNRMVKKIAGVIKTESVVIIGADRTVVELKTKAPL
jgi:hypothetical protein